MISYIKTLWKPVLSHGENQSKYKSLLLRVFLVIAEDVIFWERNWLSLYFIFLFNIVFFVSWYQQLNILQFAFCLYIALLCMDAIESWLKYKRRIKWLKEMASYEVHRFNKIYVDINNWINIKCLNYIALRDSNPAKAYLLVNIGLAVILLLGLYTNGYIIVYLSCMVLLLYMKLSPPVIRFLKKIHQNMESDYEIEELLPKVSEAEIKLLSFEPENTQNTEDKYSISDWKPEDVPLDDSSDTSSEHNSYIVTSLSKEKIQTFDADVETSDSSEDEYMPLVQNEEKHVESTLTALKPPETWGSSAFSALRNLTGVVSNLVYNPKEDEKKKRLNSVDSSDSFEFVDNSDLK